MAKPNHNTGTIDLNINQIKKNLVRAQYDLANDTRNFVLENFQKQGFPHGTGHKKWEDLSKAYKAKKDRDGKSRSILVREGHLMDSFNILKKSKLRFTFGSRLPYAKKHNDGLNGIPRRRMLGHSKRLNKALNKTFDRYIFEGI